MIGSNRIASPSRHEKLWRYWRDVNNGNHFSYTTISLKVRFHLSHESVNCIPLLPRLKRSDTRACELYKRYSWRSHPGGVVGGWRRCHKL